MPDRTTKVVLTAVVAGYISGMDAAGRKTRELGGAAEKLAAQRQGFDVLGRSMLAVGALAAAAVGIAIKEFAEFDAKMSQVQALSHATAEEMDKLSQAALHMGQAIGFSANQVADAEIELVKAGIAVSDIMGGALKGALELAAAGQIDVGDATEIATIAMTQFGLAGKDIPHVADLLAAGADKALGGVSDLGEALKSGGLIAAQFGVSLDETAGTLAAFANAGLIGEVAGTDLRQMLLKLANPAVDAQKAMDDLGIAIYDQSGAFIGINKLSTELYSKLSGLTEAQRNSTLATLFGARAIAGANVLYNEGGKPGGGIQSWTDAVNSTGFAAQQAAGKMDNLKGDISKLEAAFNTGLIETGGSANDILRGMTQTLTGLVTLIADAPQPVLATVLALTGLVAVVGLVGGSALIAVPQIARFRDGLTTMGISGRTAAIGIGVASGAVAAAGVVIAIFAQAQAEATANTQEFQASLDPLTGATTDYTRTLVAQKLAAAGVFDQAKQAGISQKDLTDAVLHGGQALDDVRAKLDKAAGLSGYGALPGPLTEAKQSVERLNTELGTSKKNLDDEAEAAAGAQGPNEAAADAYKSAADEAAQLQSNLEQLIDTVNKANGVGQDAVTTNAAFRDAMDANAKAVQDFANANGVSAANLDESTASGAKNAASLADLAKKSQDAAQAQFDLDHNVDQYRSTLEAGRQAIYDQAFALTGSADAAQTLTDKIYAIPSSTEFSVLANTSDAQKRLDAINKSLATFKASSQNLVAFIRTQDRGSENGDMFSGGVKAFANGGFPSGIYAGRPGGIHKFAEENVGWEAYISGKPGQEGRNRQIAMMALGKLGGTQYAPGGPQGGGNITVVLQSKGGIDLTQYIEARIVQNDIDTATNVNSGGMA